MSLEEHKKNVIKKVSGVELLLIGIVLRYKEGCDMITLRTWVDTAKTQHRSVAATIQRPLECSS